MMSKSFTEGFGWSSQFWSWRWRHRVLLRGFRSFYKKL